MEQHRESLRSQHPLLSRLGRTLASTRRHAILPVKASNLPVNFSLTKIISISFFKRYFKQKVSFRESIVKISDEIPRNYKDTINTVVYTKELENVFKENARHDKSLRWQYFGSSSGLMRLYPAREWDTNFAGFYNDYDPRVRNWYIAATSGPKDVVIVIDCSLSMKGKTPI